MNIKLFEVRLDDRYLQSDQEKINSFMEQITIKKTATQFVPGEPDYWSVMVFYENEKTKKTLVKESKKTFDKEPEKFSVEPDVELNDQEKEIVNALKQWRKDKASVLNVPDFMICHNAELLAVTKMKPRSMADLSKVKGFGDQKIAKHGDEIISVINAF